MPVQQFDEQAAPNGVNYWGYQPVSWFAPHCQYSSRRSVVAVVDEFRDLVKALHRDGIEVILDVVFNHTAEDDEHGPTLSLRGLDNPTYYILDAKNPAKYIDDTGCGHTINGNETIVRRMIIDCLRYWVEEMHVDGFRFDLAASLSRGEDGVPLARPPILLDIEADPVLAGVKIIAEAWDAAGLYQVASFGIDRWAVWNGQYRDHVRRFVKSDAGAVGALADNIVGSANLFHQPDRSAYRSVNFITAHDGFTLNDLVSYGRKHNEANGAGNRDGAGPVVRVLERASGTAGTVRPQLLRIVVWLQLQDRRRSQQSWRDGEVGDAEAHAAAEDDWPYVARGAWYRGAAVGAAAVGAAAVGATAAAPYYGAPCW